MFKEITAKFKVVKDIAFEQKKFSWDRCVLEFIVKRQKSGASAYGDRSAHGLEITKNGEWLDTKYYDTRYDGISTEKEEWLDFWKKYIEDNWTLKVELVDYEEKMVEDNDK